MSQSEIMSIGAGAMWMAMELALPILVSSLLVGLSVSLFQAVTQLQEPTLTFIPKIIAVVVVMVFIGPWMVTSMIDYTNELFGLMEEVGRSTRGGP